MSTLGLHAQGQKMGSQDSTIRIDTQEIGGRAGESFTLLQSNLL